MDGLVEKYGWQQICQKGNFEIEKALMSVEATKESFLSDSNYKAISDVFNNPSASLATLGKYQGEKAAVSVLMVLLKKVVDFFNVGKSMGSEQLFSTAKLIISEYYYLEIGDIKVCLRNGMLGKYGQLFDRLDGAIIIDWFSRYNSERQEVASVHSHNSHKTKMKEVESSNTSEYMPEYLVEKIKELEKKKSITQFETIKIKYATFEDYLKSIGKNTENIRAAILEHWRKELGKGEIPFNGYCLYRVNQLMNDLNNGRSLPEEISIIIKPPEQKNIK